MTQLTPHFSLAEFTTTNHRHLNNDLPAMLLRNAKTTLEMMERIRAALGDVPILISSGYRSLPVNRAVGSKDTSDHIHALAVDFSAPKFGSPFDVCTALAPRVDELSIGQLIYEALGSYEGWVHVSSKVPANANNRVITIDRLGARVGILTKRG